MNKQILDILGITEDDYLNWCKMNNNPSYKSEVRTEFFAKIQDGKLVKDKDGNLIKKN